MRRTLTAFTALTALALAACGGEEPAEAPEPGAGASEAGDAAEAGAADAPNGETGSDAEAAAILAEYGEPWAGADIEAGRRAFRVCQTCHTLREGDRHMVGPNLYGLFSRNVGEAEDFRYSTALQEADFAWTPEQLNEWLANPRDFLPGNRMSFAGLRDEETRADVIAYLAVETHAD